MPFIADFHIHSHFSIATSKQLQPEYLDYWGGIKGIKVVGTGDFTHPGWLAELKEKLIPAEHGLFRLKPGLMLQSHVQSDVRFILTSEISNIYKKDGKVRKVHNVIFAPDFETVEKIQKELGKLGNITSDGRPILGLDSRDLLEIALQANENIFFLPAHIWTPWFSALGSKSGFDSIEQCYGDLAGHIHAVETGLSTNSPMNWMCSFLDRYTLLSNSDAHSPQKLGRNANMFECDLNYSAMIESIKNQDKENFLGTIDMFPQEGKYHYDGHRKCGICWNPVETLKHNQFCPECGKPVTLGVMNRLVQLSDREDLTQRSNRKPYHSIIPLKEILAEILSVGDQSLKVDHAYHQLIKKAGTEFNVLLHMPLEELELHTNDILTEAIRRMRQGEVYIEEGFDGQYGKIKVFNPNEKISLPDQQNLFSGVVTDSRKSYKARALLNFNLSEYRVLQREAKPRKEKTMAKETVLNENQMAAINHFRGPALCVAGPGSGKTKVLTDRIQRLLQDMHVNPASTLVLTFANKATAEMKRRLEAVNSIPDLSITTFHALGLKIIRENDMTDKAPVILDESDQKYILQNFLSLSKKDSKSILARIGESKQQLLSESDIVDVAFREIFREYQKFLKTQNLLDLDDLIYYPVLLFRNNHELLKKYRAIFQWILIDEYQDVNYAQYQFSRLLAGDNNPNLFVVGDPDQAIYGFRGANVTFIRRFLEDYPTAKRYRLTKSYRCSGNILKASQDILTASSVRQDPVLSGIRSNVKIEIVREASHKSEAEFVARRIEQMLGGVHFFSMDSGVSAGRKNTDINGFGDFAVLSRTSAQMSAMETALDNHRIPWQRAQGNSFLHTGRVKLAVDLFVLCHFPENHFLQQKLTALEIIGISIPPRPNPKKTIVQRLEKLLSAFPTLSLTKKEKESLLSYAEAFGYDESEFIQETWLRSGGDDHQYKLDKVSLLTMHAAKGLEFKAVFVTGCEEGLIPYSLYEKDKVDIDEEQRLLYVAMTRAEKYLFLTHAKKRELKGRHWQLQRSSFLDKIEQTLLQSRQNKYKPKPKKNEGQRKLF